MFDLYGWGLYVGEVARIRIRIHWLLLLFWVFELNDAVRGDPETRSLRVLAWLTGVVLTFGSILLHEFGHCFAARKVGGDADEVLLWPFGGLAFCQCPDYWRAHLIVAAGGPLVTLVIAGLSFVGFGYFNEHGSEALLRNPIYGMAEFYLTYWNGILLVFNLIPLYPLDGGRVFHSLAWGWFGRQGGYAWGGYGLASRLTLHVSRVTAALGIVACLYLEMQFAILLLAWAWWQAERLNEGRHY